MIRVLVNGVFDPLHIGHINLLRNAKALGDFLVVAVPTDERAKSRGKTPIMPYHERAEIVRAIRYVDMVIPIRLHDNRLDMVRNLKIGLVVYGDDYLGKTTDDNITGVPIIYLPYTEGINSTRIREQMKGVL